MPNIWPTVSLSEVLSPRQETPDKDDLQSGSIGIVEKIGFEDGKITLRDKIGTNTEMILIWPGDLVISGINALKGAIAIYDPTDTNPVGATIHYSAYVPHANKIDVQYLWRYLRSSSFRRIAENQLHAGIKTELRAPSFLSLRVPIPPLAEQRRIVDTCSKVEEILREVRKLRQQVAESTDLILPVILRQVKSKLEDEYPRSRILEVASLVGGGTPSKAIPSFWNGTIPWVAPKDMKSWHIKDTRHHITPEALTASPAKLIPAGAVLIVVRGMILARNVPVAVASIPLAINQDMKAFIPRDFLNSTFLCYMLAALERDLLARVERSSHDTRRIQSSSLGELSIPIPPIGEQTRIVEYFETLRGQIEAIRALQNESLQTLPSPRSAASLLSIPSV
jgi:type I restriction enzyme, S subunit